MTRIPLTGKRGQGTYALIDDDDIERVSRYSWHVTPRGYACARVAGRLIFLHRFVMGDPRGLLVDHRSGDKLDCRKSNLRPCTKSQNNWNRHDVSGNPFGLRGITYLERTGTWKTYIRVNNRQKHIGLYKNLADAVRAYNLEVTRLRGEFAVPIDISPERIAEIEATVRPLRIAERSSRRVPSKCSSGFRGVSWNKNAQKWRAYFQGSVANIHLGYFTDREEAAYVHDQVALQLLDDFAVLNLL